MRLHRYELRLFGTPPQPALTELAAGAPMFGGGPVALGRVESVLITNRMGQGDLCELLVHICDLGLDVRELRRLPAA